MLYIYRQRNSASARELAEEIMLLGTRARRTKGERLRTLVAGDAVICWGDTFAVPVGLNIKTLNNQAPLNKFAEAQRLAEKGVPTVRVSRTPPAVAAVRQPFAPDLFRVQGATVNEQAAAAYITQLQSFVQAEQRRRAAWAAQPAVPAETWLPRRNNHVGGNDLLTPNLPNPDFYSKKEELVEEYRLHMFGGKSIRAGRKIHRPEGRPNGGVIHPWVRSFDAGWIIQYDGFESTKAMRDIAAAAVKALDLDFAAVDIGKKADGSFIVLEVNRAPGCEGNTVTAYARKFIEWLNAAPQAAPQAARRA